tara:strand:+ start:472 stop:1674 length:1203 start_codon:yes stop_codon:yes gene_type:complete
MLPFIKKYQPTLDTIKGQDSAIQQLTTFLTTFDKQKKKALFLWGPSGTGKTSSASALAKQYNLDLIEVNASDVRNKAQIQERLGNAIQQQSLFSEGKLILVDEIDGLSGMKDRGAVPTIAKLIDKTTFPIIITAYNPYDQKLSTIRSRSILIEYAALDYLATTDILKDIAKQENITYDEVAIKTLARRSGGDARAAINDLQILTINNKLTKESIESLHDRERQENIIQSLLKVFKTTNPKVALPAFDYVSEDMDKILLWIDENLPREYTKSQDLVRAYQHLSKADVYKGRIRRWQHWRFLVYISTLLTAGIATAKDEKYPGFSSYKPTMRILKIWQANMKHAKKKAISTKIAKHTHTSTRRVLDSTFPYFKEAFRNNKDFQNSMTETLDLDKDEIAWLKK